MRRLDLTLAMLLATTVASACAGFSPDPDQLDREPFTEPERPTSITLLVQNRNFADARLFVLRRGATRSLGVVGGKAETEFDIDWDMSDPIRVRIDLLAGPSCTTDEILADPGDVLELQIAQNFMHTRGCR